MIIVYKLTARRVADSGRVAMIMWSEGSSISFCRREGERKHMINVLVLDCVVEADEENSI